MGQLRQGLSAQKQQTLKGGKVWSPTIPASVDNWSPAGLHFHNCMEFVNSILKILICGSIDGIAPA